MEASGTTAWVADDDQFFRIAIRSILVDRLGMGEVIEMALLDDALERMSERSDIAIALFDLAMPGMDSPENLGAVRDLFPDTRVVASRGEQPCRRGSRRRSPFGRGRMMPPISSELPT